MPTVLAKAVLAAAVFLGGMALVLAASAVPAFFDPCHEWGMRSGGSVAIAPGDACQSRSATSETKGEAVLRMAIVFGGTIVASSLGAVGALRGLRPPLLVGAAMLFALSVLLFFGASIAFLLVLGAAVLFLVAGLQQDRRRRAIH